MLQLLIRDYGNISDPQGSGFPAGQGETLVIELRQLSADEAPPRPRQLEIERELVGLVEDAFGLTAAEKNFVRATLPQRDPITVLAAKVE